MNIYQELRRLPMLRGRTPDTSDADRETAFRSLGDYRDGSIALGHYAGTTAWERHVGDEIVLVLEGAGTLHIEGRVSIGLRRGTLVVVPQQTWHQIEALDGIAVLTVTPHQSDTEHGR